MKLTAILALAATAASSALPAGLPAGVEYTQISAADIPESVRLAPAFNQTAVSSIEARDGDLSKRANHGVYLCVDANWGGHCAHITAGAGVCVPLASDLNDKVSSVGPDTGAYCRFYFDAGCMDNDGCKHFDLTTPGRSDLNQAGSGGCAGVNPNDKITSYQCWNW